MLELLKKQMEERRVKELEKSGDKDINKKTWTFFTYLFDSFNQT